MSPSILVLSLRIKSFYLISSFQLVVNEIIVNTLEHVVKAVWWHYVHWSTSKVLNEKFGKQIPFAFTLYWKVFSVLSFHSDFITGGSPGPGGQLAATNLQVTVMIPFNDDPFGVFILDPECLEREVAEDVLSEDAMSYITNFTVLRQQGANTLR